MVTVETWPFEISAFASEVNLLILRENSCSFRHDTSKFNQSVQVDLSQLTELVFHWQATDTHINLMVDQMVLGVDFSNDVTSHLVEDREHMSWFFCKPDGESRLFT